MSKDERVPTSPGVPGDSTFFKVMTEIDMIAHMAGNEFEKHMPDGLTQAQFGVLNRLMRLEAQETIGELADAFQVTQPTMSSTLKRLEAKGYSTFVPDTEDRRLKRVRVTRSGRAVRNKAVRALDPYFEMVKAEAPFVDLDGLLPALTRMRVFLEQRKTNK